MERVVIKICFVFSLMMMSLTNSAVAIKTQKELLDSLDLERSKVVLRVLHALRHNQKFDLLTEFPADTPHRMRKAQHVREVLLFIFKGKIERTKAVWKESSEKSQTQLQGQELSAYQSFLNERRFEKEGKYEKRITSLNGIFNNSEVSEITSDFILFEGPDPQTVPTSSTSTLPIHVDLDILDIIYGFVLMDKVFSLTEKEVMESEIISDAEAAGLSALVLHTPLLEAGSSTDTSQVKDAPSTLIAHNAFLEELNLDEKSAKIILKSILKKDDILKGTYIPSKEFNLEEEGDQDKYAKVVNYLLFVLQNKEEKVLDQIAALVSGHPRYEIDRDRYDSKLTKYKDCMKAITSPDMPETPVPEKDWYETPVSQ